MMDRSAVIFVAGLALALFAAGLLLLTDVPSGPVMVLTIVSIGLIATAGAARRQGR